MPIILAGRWLQRGWGQGSGLCLAWAVSGGLDQATLLGDNKNSTGSWATQVMWIEKGTRRLFVHLLFNRRIAWRGRPSSVSCSGKAAIFFWSDKDRWPCYKHFQLGFHNSFILYHILFFTVACKTRKVSTSCESCGWWITLNHLWGLVWLLSVGSLPFSSLERQDHCSPEILVLLSRSLKTFALWEKLMVDISKCEYLSVCHYCRASIHPF